MGRRPPTATKWIMTAIAVLLIAGAGAFVVSWVLADAPPRPPAPDAAVTRGAAP